MYQIDFNKPEHVHFIGIGGVSMGDLTEILLDEGFSISGSDSHETALMEHLEKKGARVYYRRRAANIEREPGVSVVVYTAAIHEDNSESKAARGQRLSMLSRAELLGELMRNYKGAIAISGTHGKTTTTSIPTDVLLAGDLDPTVSVGGILKDIGGNIRVGGPDLFVTEAYKYTSSFLSFYPTMEVILNVEEDHLDFFRDTEGIRHSLRLFVDRLPTKRLLVVNSGIKKVEEIIKGLNCRMVTFGKDLSNTYTTRNITYDGFARPPYDLIIQGEAASRIILSVIGERNVYSSLAVIAVVLELGVGFDAIMSRLGKFTDTDRRLEKKGEMTGVTVIDGYAHHPQEIRVAPAAAQSYPHRKLWYIFQPHTYTRTRAFLDQFTGALSTVDEVILADIYTARETDTLGISSWDVVDRIEKLGTKAHCIPSLNGTETSVLENYMNDDLLITMGAGDIVRVRRKLLEQ